MDAAHDARCPGRPLNLRAEARAAFGLWLLPALLALLPYRAGIALARVAARLLPLYAEAAGDGAARYREVTGADDVARWIADYRFAQLVDHMDLFWSMTRSRRFLARRLSLPGPQVAVRVPLLVLSFHFGQGLWLMHALAERGVRARFVSIRLAREEAAGSLPYAYARLRIRAVERLARIAPIFTGGARQEIGRTLEGGGAVYGLVDVPVPGAASERANTTLFGRPVLLPAGLVESARGCNAQVLVLTSHVSADGERVVRADDAGPADALTIDRVAALLEQRLREAPAAWHFWHLWPGFLAQPR